MIELISTLVLPLLLVGIPAYGLLRGVPVYEAFVEGAREGFTTAVRIIPYLVAILFAIGMFRASGAMDAMIAGLRGPLGALGIDAELLPMAVMRPLSGSGSVGVLADLIREHGEGSLIVKTAATMFGSTETTFYVLAVYFGAVGISRPRYAVKVGLLADAAGLLAAIVVCRWLYA